ncbi:MAG: signal recognition particle-docking protein FtsY [Candidatus Euphemobacter frigidus]|nr:signal recognition particle-docking protein FtsY [Candidatus Euphemobacter frigidus]MDP8275092.1 signal recognition particle-docking protein FtsY [Candidatus Euphemobacter frigidus]
MTGNLKTKKRQYRNSLGKTRRSLKNKISHWLGKSGELSDDFWEDWEAALIEVDLGVETTVNLLDRVRMEMKNKKGVTPEMVKSRLIEELIALLSKNAKPLSVVGKARESPVVIMVVGVNGTGKTTTIAKLAHRLRAGGSRVLLGACDTFRAAAIEQLQIWAQRIGVDLIQQRYGGDPAAVAFDALQAAVSRGYDYLILDTAGRLHTRTGLMDELEKIARVLRKIKPSAPDEIYLCLDATFGQNGLVQAGRFAEALPLTGVLLAKLDGTARGGIVVSIQQELGIPVVAVGVGEALSDLLEFDPRAFTEALLAE